ncbi:DUF1799 domain-containing protein [Achromobacter xylosoxidans]|uniref:DUF1799 domain-containing protein n=1 Tax=Alcaligenes xylosoxydans xylosoxydans TaxID=85698 RepID=UPI002F968756
MIALGAALYRRPPNAKELEAFGLTAEDVEAPPVEIWPENQQAFEIFASLRTQWRVSFAGVTGLDYGVLYRRLDRLGLSAERCDELEEQIRVLEDAAMQEINRK